MSTDRLIGNSTNVQAHLASGLQNTTTSHQTEISSAPVATFEREKSTIEILGGAFPVSV